MPKKEFANYREKKTHDMNMKISEMRDKLPEFCESYFNHISRLKPNTQLSYATDLLEFFIFLEDRFAELSDIPIKSLPVSCLELPKRNDIDRWLTGLKRTCFNSDKSMYKVNCSPATQKRKLACLKAFYRFYLLSDDESERITNDPVSLVKLKPIDQGEVLYMRNNEIRDFMDNVETREFFNEEKLQEESGKISKNREIVWSEKNEIRDAAICMLILSTGIRVSECAGLDVGDIDLKAGTIRIYRKGHDKDSIVLLGDKAQSYIKTYLEYGRPAYLPENEASMEEIDRNALWLTRFHKRMGVPALQRMVKKYEKDSVHKGITFHKLRSTFGTEMAKKNGLKKAQVALGHSSPTTTSRFYVAVDEEEMREAYRKVEEDL